MTMKILKSILYSILGIAVIHGIAYIFTGEINVFCMSSTEKLVIGFFDGALISHNFKLKKQSDE